VEALNYALAYESENAIALCLMGNVQAEFLKDHTQAKTYYQQAFSANNSYCELYPNYIECLCMLEEFDTALRLVDFALQVKGINKSEIYFKEAMVHERMHKFKKALQSLDKAILNARSNSFIHDVEEFQKLIERKQKVKNGEKSSK
jgi:tetratricopeptide (TPR) repeat protein